MQYQRGIHVLLKGAFYNLPITSPLNITILTNTHIIRKKHLVLTILNSKERLREISVQASYPILFVYLNWICKQIIEFDCNVTFLPTYSTQIL